MLRDELASAERRLEDERFSAASARQSFAAREQELEVSQHASLTDDQFAGRSPGFQLPSHRFEDSYVRSFMTITPAICTSPQNTPP